MPKSRSKKYDKVYMISHVLLHPHPPQKKHRPGEMAALKDDPDLGPGPTRWLRTIITQSRGWDVPIQSLQVLHDAQTFK